MDITDNNFQIMSEYLANTLNPDVNVRRPGKSLKFYHFSFYEIQASEILNS